MKIFIIAQIMRGKEVVGYRLLDVDSKNEVKQYPVNSIKQVLSNPATADIIKNAKLVNGVITGTNGQLSRYPMITADGLLLNKNGESPLIVINKIDNIGYTVSDFKGKVVKMKNSDVVEYAKRAGIANGKVVMQDNIEYISSISDTYEQISLTPSKVGDRSKVNIAIHIDKDASAVARHTENDINTEIQYNDVFSAMTPEQRNVLKQFYTWYTVDVYKSLAKNVRLQLAPGKAEKLAQLRGVTEWKFAGVNDSYLEGRFSAKCELGHNLRYEYFALPEDEAKDINARTGKWNNRYAFNTTRNAQDDLRDSGAIVFGETCASDFFNIAPDDMKKLVKTRKIMSEEIELMADTITNKMEQLYTDKCKFLYDCLREMGSAQSVITAFGEQIGYTLLAFIKAKMPFTKSLVILASDAVRKNKKAFYKEVFKDKQSMFDAIIGNESNQALSSVNIVLNYITSYTIEGEYQYDPLNDRDNTRRDVGAYNKETRHERQILNRRVFASSMLSTKNITLDSLKTYISLVYKALNICKEAEEYVRQSTALRAMYNENSEKGKTRLIIDLRSYIENYNTNVEDNEVALFDVLVNSLSFSKEYAKLSYFTNKTHIYSSRYRNKTYYPSLEDMCNAFESIDEQTDKFVKGTLGKYESHIKEEAEAKIERELKEPGYFSVKLKDDDTEYVTKASGKEKLSIRNYMQHGTLELESLELYKDNIVNCSNIETIKEISVGYYAYKTREVDDALKSKLMQEEQERKQKELEERQRLEEEQRKQKEAEENKKVQDRIDRFNKDEKLNKLKDLISKHPELKDDYGVTVSNSIMERQTPYSELSAKQQWRIDDTLKKLGESVEVAAPTIEKKKLADNNDVATKIDKLCEIIKSKDKDKIDKINKASKIAIDVVKTVKHKGEYSEKQLKHIDKAFDAIQ